MITERDISNADIVWRRNNTAVNITCIIALATSGGLYRSYYTITQLNTSDDGIMYECGLVVHATSSVIAGTGTVHLNVTSEYVYNLCRLHISLNTIVNKANLGNFSSQYSQDHYLYDITICYF